MQGCTNLVVQTNYYSLPVVLVDFPIFSKVLFQTTLKSNYSISELLNFPKNAVEFSPFYIVLFGNIEVFFLSSRLNSASVWNSLHIENIATNLEVLGLVLILLAQNSSLYFV